MADDERTEPAEPGEVPPAPAEAPESGGEPTTGVETAAGVTSTPSPPDAAAVEPDPAAEAEAVAEPDADAEPGDERDAEAEPDAEVEPTADAEPGPGSAVDEPAPGTEAGPAERAGPDEPEPAGPGDGPEPAPAMAADHTTDERLDGLLLQLEHINFRIDELSRLGARQVEHIDRLHADNQQLRAGELRQALAPLVRALVRHHDDVAKLASSATQSSEAKVLEIVRSGVLKVLVTAGVEQLEIAPGDRFDPSRHQGVGRIETADAELDGTIAAVRRCGFMADDGRIVRPAEVEVYRLA